ncbi:MAG: HAD family phosphatase [bacterium]|nr:HAD family phosphatase [bacterium]
MLRAILFDMNGVLVDDEPLHLELLRRVLSAEGVELATGDYFANYLGLTDRSCVQAILEATGRSPTPERVAHLVARKAALYRTRIRDQGVPFFPGARELVEAATAGGLMLGIVSGALREEVECAAGELGGRRRFKALVTADDVDAGKPDPEGYRRGLELLNTRPPRPSRLLEASEVLAIEDSPVGLRAATAAGLATLGVAQTYPAESLTGADEVVGSLRDVTLPRIRTLLANQVGKPDGLRYDPRPIGHP